MIDISVILPTCKRPLLLRCALSSIAAQTLSQEHFEVIVIDNNPSEATASVVKSFEKLIINLRYLEEHAQGLHNARHLGVREAKSDLLVFCDDDIEAMPSWLEGVWRGFHECGADLVGGKNLPKWESAPPPWIRNIWESDGDRFVGFLSILDFGDSEKIIDPFFVWGCNFSVRKKVLLEAGGFHPDSMPSDLLIYRGDGETHVSRFVAERGYKALYIPEASIYHFVSKKRMTVEYFRQRAFRQGISDSFSKIRLDPSTINVEVPSRGLKGWLLSMRLVQWFLSFSSLEHYFLDAIINRAHTDGFGWHCHHFQNDPKVRSWVLRDDYLDASM